MRHRFGSTLTRRKFLAAGAAAIGAAALPSSMRSVEAATAEIRLVAAPARARLVPLPHGETSVWAYNGLIPGPEIRLRQGQRLRVVVGNRLAEETTVHWHGLRLPNRMDGVPHLTQKPIAPGETFVYEFDCPDAGTFWYHPHQRSLEQVDRGLYGPLIVDEAAPITVDRDVTWVLDDWRLRPDASIAEGFGNMMDTGMAGRIGNTVTVNGRLREAFAVRAGERIRLRLINAANARIFELEFEGHDPQVIALDGQPVEPHAPVDGRIVLGPAMRADLVIDMTGAPRARFRVVDTFYRDLEYRLLHLVYGETPRRQGILDAPIQLPGNPLPEPELSTAERHEITFGGGMMSGGMTGMRGSGVWNINGVSASGHQMDPMLTLARGRSCVLALRNDTAWHHPIHLHGHSFRVLSRNGRPTRHREWQDTVLLAPREQAEIAFVADNPGDWMLHCHVLEHQDAGMMGVVRVGPRGL